MRGLKAPSASGPGARRAGHRDATIRRLEALESTADDEVQVGVVLELPDVDRALRRGSVDAMALKKLNDGVKASPCAPVDLVARRPGRAPREEMTKWVADRSARRVPTFVIELTGGLDTKKRIVQKFGENAAFEKGKPLPKAVK
jgi:hypothetical protein